VFEAVLKRFQRHEPWTVQRHEPWTVLRHEPWIVQRHEPWEWRYINLLLYYYISAGGVVPTPPLTKKPSANFFENDSANPRIHLMCALLIGFGHFLFYLGC